MAAYIVAIVNIADHPTIRLTPRGARAAGTVASRSLIDPA